MSNEEGARLRRLHSLASWLETQPGASAAWAEVEIADYGEAGFGFRAASDIAQGSVLCAIPVRLAFSALAARVSPTLGPLLQRCSGLRDDDAIALLLLHERAQGAASPRAAHLDSLPAAYDATLFWSDAELEELRGSPLHAQTLQLRAQTEADWHELHAAIVAPQPALFPPALCDLEAYRWALATLWSRAMDLPVGDGAATMRIISPWADMFNNDPDVPVCHAHERSGNAVVVIAGRRYKKGDAVCINYGLKTAADALRLHGFVPEKGARIEVPVYAEMSEHADLYAAKRRLLDAAGVRAGAAFLLTAEEPLPPSLLLALRVQRATAVELAAAERAGGLKAGARVSAENERASLSALHGGLTSMLDAYPTTADADEALLADASAAAELSPRQRAAIQLRLGEKRILTAALLELQALLDAADDTAPPADAAKQAEAASSSDDDAPPPALEDIAAAAMATAKAPEAAAGLAAYFESLLAETGEGEQGSKGECDALD